jgi:hypothetical protein
MVMTTLGLPVLCDISIDKVLLYILFFIVYDQSAVCFS